MLVVIVLAVVVYVWRFFDLLEAAGAARGFPEPSILDFQLYMVLGCAAQIVVHEGGHWLALRAVGWGCLRFQVGPLRLKRGRNGWEAEWRWSLAALVAGIPTFSRFRVKNAIFAAGGSLGSLLGGLVFALIAWRATSAPVFWLFGNLAMWTLVGALSLVPVGSGLHTSDGSRVWALLRGGDRVAQAQRYMLGNLSRGTPLRPRDWPEPLMRPLLDAGLPCRDKRDCYAVYLYLIDRGEPDAALPWLTAVLSGWKKGDPPQFAQAAAYHVALYLRKPDEARQWLGMAGKGDDDPWVRLRVEAAICWAAGHSEAARRAGEQAALKLESAPPCGDTEYERTRIRELLERVGAGATAAAG